MEAYYNVFNVAGNELTGKTARLRFHLIALAVANAEGAPAGWVLLCRHQVKAMQSQQNNGQTKRKMKWK